MNRNEGLSPETTLLRTVEEMRRWRRELRSRGRSVALVPTMGSLHEGHLSLVDRARQLADGTVLSVFVNPTQFGPGEDFAEYPRDLDRDLSLAAERGVDATFAPEDREMYPVPPTVWVDPGPLGQRLCGLSRPTHFRGVLTVVAKLFGIVEPDVAVFGRKDFQQEVLIRRMVEELRLPVQVRVVPIFREPDGLAMSSRNTYLTGPEREVALSLSLALRRVRAAYSSGTRLPEPLIREARSTMEEAGARVDYVEIVDPDLLEPVAVAELGADARPDAVCAVAAHVGATRLIDNASLGGPSSLEGLADGPGSV